MDDPFVTINPADVPGNGVYHLLNAAIAPRPIAWVASLAADGTPNIAPHSYTTVFSPNPPIVGFVSVGRKDTLRNVLATGEFVYHIADEALAERLNLTAADFPSDVSEFDWAGLTPIPSDLVRTPRVAEAPIAFEATAAQVQQVRETNNYLITGEIVRIHLAERILSGDRIDPAKLRALGRLAGSQFSYLGELFKMERPTYRGLLEAGATPVRSKTG
ncbi:MAG TPA: flavin reductase family protein [Thermomicrobiales bacterium]|jgi:flavin reductase (DIM6/NTAB) family NADH-FMN oxidoreductase RutF